MHPLRNVPLAILSVQDGKPVVDKSPVLRERETTISLDVSKPFKLNAGTNGVCAYLSAECSLQLSNIALDRVLYTPERLAKIAAEAAKEDSPFSLEDRLGLVSDSIALSKAGLAKLSSALTLIEQLKGEKECQLSQIFSNQKSDQNPCRPCLAGYC